MPNELVVVHGLKEYRKGLVPLYGKGVSKAIGAANKRAGQFVVDKAEDKGRQLGGVFAHVIAAGSIRSSAKARQATVVLGGPGAKHGPAFGAEFGANAYRQFPPWRGNQWAPDTDNGVGHMLHPAIRENRAEFVELYANEINALARGAYPDK